MSLQPQPRGGGTLRRHAGWAPEAPGSRYVEIWCPPAYEARPETRFPVIYTHDGQNLFDGTYAYGGVDWGVAEAMARVSAEHDLAGAIVVGIWNSPQRWLEYYPERPLRRPEARELAVRIAAELGSPASDSYLRYIVEELKPRVDKAYRTLPGRESSFLMGSSMGGLISLYGLSEYPEIFGGAACLSTHWSAGDELLVAGMGAALPPAGSHRIYFDYGTLGLDAAYEPLQQLMDGYMRAAGYSQGEDWVTLKFDGADHNETAWRERLHLPLAFLLRHHVLQ